MHKPLLVTDFLDRARRHYADETAVVATTGERYTYDEFGERADRFSAFLQSVGVEEGDRVAVLDPNTHYQLEAAYGTMQVGAVHTPLNYRLTADDYAYILADAGVTAIYADHEYAHRVEEIRDEVPTETFVTNDADAVDGDWRSFDDELDAAGTGYDRPEMSEDDVVTINYTSGTTGDPKGVCRTHRAETLHSYLVTAHQDISDDDVYLWTLPMFHVNGWGHIYSITGNGATHVCTRGVDAESVFDAIQTEDVSYLCAAPTVLNMLMNYYDDHDGDVRTAGTNPVRAATAGAAPPESTLRTVEGEFGWTLMHVYGATETGPLITTSHSPRHLAGKSDDERFELMKRQGIGYLGTEVRVVDEDGADVPRDGSTIGEIVVRGNQVMDRYWNKPEATEEAFSERREGYYHMGDLATWDEDGFVAIQDRKKDIIISGGENISTIELEDVLYDHPEIAKAAVIPAPSEQWGETPKAVVVPTADATIDPDDVKAFVADRVANFKRITRVEFVDQLPETATGKVQKYELREREWEDEESMVGQG
ncbi:long-chain-fatty-acid--CoA ligase [Haloarchaeobius litoreus]|uniref:Long-chain-fatty-acid--CoA ligase n=1 Tax=Haloarchaeobius litoreus TaxID=755306 RepID=A0ABD6DKZ1_9EURY|nr:long-chain-fatty-acid--CoA ligase [Haloarchaeobius litoreus]